MGIVNISMKKPQKVTNKNRLWSSDLTNEYLF